MSWHDLVLSLLPTTTYNIQLSSHAVDITSVHFCDTTTLQLLSMLYVVCTWKSFALIRLSKLLFICIALAFNLCCKSRVSPQPYSETKSLSLLAICYSYPPEDLKSFSVPIAKQNQQVAHIFQHEAAQAGKPTEISIKMPFVAIASCHKNELRTENWKLGIAPTT